MMDFFRYLFLSTKRLVCFLFSLSFLIILTYQIILLLFITTPINAVILLIIFCLLCFSCFCFFRFRLYRLDYFLKDILFYIFYLIVFLLFLPFHTHYHYILFYLVVILKQTLISFLLLVMEIFFHILLINH